MFTFHGWRITLSCLVLGAYFQSALATNQIVGVTSSGDGACLVKRFQVEAGSVIQGFEFVNNDDRTVFPSVALLRGPATQLSEAVPLVQLVRVGSTGPHRVRVSFAPIPVASSQEVWAVIRFPANNGVRGVGEGAGLGATQIDGPGDSYVAPTPDEKFQRINFSLGVSLQVGNAGKATGETPLEQNAPTTFLRVANPTVAATTIAFGVERPTFVSLIVYDIAGRQVRTLVHESLPAGVYSRSWDGRDKRGEVVAAGVYISKLRVGDGVLTKKLVLMK